MPREVMDQRSLHPGDAHLQLEKNQTPEPTSNAVEDITLTSLQARLEIIEKNCSRYFDLYKNYRLRWLEENHQAEVLQKYAPDVDGYSPAQMPWDAPSPHVPGKNSEWYNMKNLMQSSTDGGEDDIGININLVLILAVQTMNLEGDKCDISHGQMGSDVFNANGSMGMMPERIISQAEFFWARSNAIAAITPTVTPAIIPLVAPAVPPATSASTGIGHKLKALLRMAIKGVTIALRAILHADGCVALV
ncbi:hypothetical protein BDR05DRAFT_951104 [Suillus weaverae]|nr:hypothetical protein BDR05DRAFT_951104 [Suillus weaverae]